MSLQLSANLVALLFVVAIITPFIACWWTARLISQRMDGQLLQSLRDAYKDAAETSKTAVNTCAEAARAMIQGMKATSIVLQQTSEFATENSTKDALDKLLLSHSAPTANMAPDNGRWKPPTFATAPHTTKVEVDPDAPPDHIKLPGDI